jgi:hypothetical protein
MPIRVECPDCSATLAAPETAAGKTVRCPKCGARMVLPAADEPEPEPEREDDAPSTRRAPIEDDREDDDEAEERPKKSRKASKRKKKAKATFWAWVGAGVVILIAVAVPVARAVRFHLLMDGIEERERQKEERAQNAKSRPGQQVTTDWTKFEVPLSEFVVEFPPGCPSAQPMWQEERAPGETEYTRTWRQPVGERLYTVCVRQHRLTAGQSEPEEVSLWARNKTGLTTVAGLKAQKYTADSKNSRGEAIRHFALEVSLPAGRVLTVRMVGAAGDTWETPEVAQFFARVTPKR